jgi:hypothetical protein
MRTLDSFSRHRLPVFALALATLPLAAAEPNQLTPEETAAGWRLLFDGKTTQGWRSFRKDRFPSKGWVVEEGWLKCIAGGRGGDIVTVDQFTDFDLRWEWRLPPRANNGVKYFITEERSQAIGHEYQLIDETLVKNDKQRTASFYDVLPPRSDKPLKPPGEINQSRILVQGNHVEHWLNGAKVLEYELGSEAVAAAIARSKFKSVSGFGTKIKGRLLLTEHGSEACFRSIKLRPLPASE